MNLTKGQDIVILTYQSVDFIQVVDTPLAPYIYNGSAIAPKPSLWTVKEDELVVINNTDYIEDDNDILYLRIVGARPRNIVKR
jgi:hypothetical protein